jgi:hypothetical protein
LIVVAQVRRDILRIGLFAGLFFSRFSKPNTGATAVLVEELDTGSFQGSANGEVVGGCHRSLSISQLGAADGR